MARLTSSMNDAKEDAQAQSSKLEALPSYVKGLETNLEIRSEQLKEESTTHGREITTLKSKLESATRSHEDNMTRIRVLETQVQSRREI